MGSKDEGLKISKKGVIGSKTIRTVTALGLCQTNGGRFAEHTRGAFW